MPEYCHTCRLNKTKVHFDLERVRAEAKAKATESGESFAIYRKGKGLASMNATDAVNEGVGIVEIISHD